MPPSNRRQITWGEVFDAQAFALLGSIYKIWPGIVTAYHPSSAGSAPSEVDVQVAVNDVRIDTTTGATVPEDWPVIPNVPLGMPQGGGYQIAFALKPGDKVLLLSFDLDPSTFRATGNQSDPVDTHRHGGGYWVALPFDITDAGGFADPGDNLVVTVPAGKNIVLGGTTDAPALASLVDANFNVVLQAVEAGLATLTGSGPATIAQVEAALTAIKSALIYQATKSTIVQTK